MSLRPPRPAPACRYRRTHTRQARAVQGPESQTCYEYDLKPGLVSVCRFSLWVSFVWSVKPGESAARFLHHSLPKRVRVGGENQLLVIVENKPAIVPDFILELARSPSGVADKNAEIGSRLIVKRAEDRGIRRQKIEVSGDRQRGARRFGCGALQHQHRR